MQFYDRVSIIVQSGRGGDGAATGRREKYVAFGGPSGGDGGDGGSVFLQASPHQWTLLPFRYKQVYKAKNGESGKSKDQYGLSGEDLILDVPVGTLVYYRESKELIASLDTPGDTLCVAKGGRGGAGNKHFISPQNQFSSIALLGEPGQKKEITLELQLIADVALIGEPSVGKSTLINYVSNVKAKTAEYHFTTLVPNLGVVEHQNNQFIMIDIPGLIEDAHQGKGLGNEFLRHIVKARLFVFLLDISRFEEGMGVFEKLFHEIQMYTEQISAAKYRKGCTREHELVYSGTGLTYFLLLNDPTQAEREIVIKKHLLLAITKGDLVLDNEIRQEYLTTLSARLHSYFKNSYNLDLTEETIQGLLPVISGATGAGVSDFLNLIIQHLASEEIPSFIPHLLSESTVVPEATIKNKTDDERELLIAQGYLPPEAEKKKQVREVMHPQIAYLSYVLPRGNDEAELRYRKTLEKEGHLSWLSTHGVKKGDILKICSPYEQNHEKYILRE